MTESSAPSAPTPTDTSTRYEPAEVEARWMQAWTEAGHFHAEPDDQRDPYCIVIPPPNVTGALHMGHALNGAIQDALTRVKRMQGYNALWLPGTDHAGIATQNVVEKELRKQGLTRHDLGRERFLERVWEWKEQYGARIIQQYRRLGSSLDYERERFTMDEQYARAVQLVFVKLYEKEYVYRDNYLVNWCGDCHTAISDLEVRQEELTDEMVQVDYPLADGQGAITVATVRPETIFADVAVAVHPEDERYRELIGRMVRVPMTDREVPVIADEYVDPEFGTGALKITPGHDQNDFEIGMRHDLEQLSAIDPDLRMSELAGPFQGMGVDEARTASIAELERLGLLREREPYRHSVPHCDRSGTRIEPLISLQWFCSMKDLARPAIQAVEDGDVRFHPDGARRIFESWMGNLKPWCLSRQLWWGHQLPVWFCGADLQALGGEAIDASGGCGAVHVSLDGPDGACSQCGASSWVRSEDVLDTWFSSGLWSFATLGWPEQTPELAYFHPTSVLVTAREIINLWVARMMMFSYELLDERPFSDVVIHSVIQAPDGRRMSKSLGTGIDPIELIDKYGADATRYGLLTMSSTQDVRFNEGKLREGRELANKLWNAARLVRMLGDEVAIEGAASGAGPGALDALEDRWIVSRLARTVEELTGLLDRYDFALYTKQLYSFVWSEYCDWYLEVAKARLRSGDVEQRASASRTAAHVLDVVLRLLHPVMPHITEEIAFQTWPGRSQHVMVSSWPDAAEGFAPDDDAEREFAQVQELVTRIRSLRSAAGVAPREILDASVEAPAGSPYASMQDAIELLARVRYQQGDGGRQGGAFLSVPLPEGTFLLFGLDPAQLRERLEKDLARAREDVRRAEGKLGNEKFVSRAPEQLVEEERAKLERSRRQESELAAYLQQL